MALRRHQQNRGGIRHEPVAEPHPPPRTRMRTCRRCHRSHSPARRSPAASRSRSPSGRSCSASRAVRTSPRNCPGQGSPMRRRASSSPCMTRRLRPGAASGTGWSRISPLRDLAAGRRGCRRGSKLPGGAFQLAGDAGAHQFVGAAPPPNSGVHNYYITVTALDVDKSGLDQNASAAYMGFAIAGHTIGRAFIVCPTAAGG